MRKLSNISIILFSLLVITLSCEDPIDVNLNEAESTLVVDGWIDNLLRIQEIKLTQSLPYFENTNAPEALDAEVIVTNTTQNTTFTFVYQSNGSYTWDATDSPIGDIGDAFALRITWNGETYTSNTTLNPSPEIDSIFVEFRTNEVFTDDGFYAQFIARDPVGFGNTYWIKTYKNDTLLNKPLELNIAYDAGFDAGSQVDGIVFITPIRELTNELDEDGAPTPYQEGDKVFVEIHSISNEAFQFLEIARDQLTNGSNGIFALPIANTRSNISNQSGGRAPVGFFNVAAITSAEEIIE